LEPVDLLSSPQAAAREDERFDTMLHDHCDLVGPVPQPTILG
jgi:hypothetical protein